MLDFPAFDLVLHAVWFFALVSLVAGKRISHERIGFGVC